jgi:tetratricopeptide (TPR) repeat protein
MGRARQAKADKTPREQPGRTGRRAWIGAAAAFVVGLAAVALVGRPSAPRSSPAPAPRTSAARPAAVQEQVARARAALEGADLIEAQTQLESAAALAPDDGEVAFLLGDVAYRGLQMEAAERHFRRATELAPSSAGAFANLALVLLEQGQAAPAAEAAQKALALEPGEARMQAVLGQARLRQGRAREAADLLESALRTGLRGAERQAALGRARDQLGQTEAALAAFDEALRDDPRLPLVHYWRADCLRRAGRTAEAQKELAAYRDCQERFARLVKLELKAREDPNDVRVWLDLARARVDRGVPSQGLAALRRAQELAPADAEVARVRDVVERAAATARDVEP